MNNFPINITIIDDGVNEELYQTVGLLHNFEIRHDLSVCERVNYDHFLPSHGTTCAAIIKKYAPGAVLTSIKILDEQSRTGMKSQLIHALKWCVDNNIRLVNMSLGTIVYRDFAEVREAVEYAFNNNVIVVAACNNRNVFTCPASLEKVIGVKCDLAGILKEGEFIYNSFPMDGIDITACAQHNLIKHDGTDKVTSVCNSFATPAVTAVVYDIIKNNPNISLFDIKKMLKEKSVKDNEAACIEMSGKDKSLNIPVIVLYNHVNKGFDKELTHNFRNDGYNAVCVVTNQIKSDFCSGYISIDHFYKKEATSLVEIFMKISGILEPDIILLSCDMQNCDRLKLRQIKGLEADIEIHINSTQNIEVISSYGSKTFTDPDNNQINRVYSYITELFAKEEE